MKRLIAYLLIALLLLFPAISLADATLPDVSISISPKNPSPGEAITLTAIASNANGTLSYQWYDVASGSKLGNSKSISFTPHEPGNYGFMCAVTNSYQGSTATFNAMLSLNVGGGASGAPAKTEKPTTTEKPKATETPKATEKPKTTQKPKATPTPEPNHTHVFGEWKTVTEADCVHPGLRERKCECGEKESEELPALGHEMSPWETLRYPTADLEGIEASYCTRKIGGQYPHYADDYCDIRKLEK